MNIIKNIKSFCSRRGLTFDIVNYDPEYQKIRIEFFNRDQLEETKKAAEKIKGAKVESWQCFAGCYEGRLYISDASEAEQHAKNEKLKKDLNNIFWSTLHDALTEGRTREEAQKEAEKAQKSAAAFYPESIAALFI